VFLNQVSQRVQINLLMRHLHWIALYVLNSNFQQTDRFVIIADIPNGHSHRVLLVVRNLSIFVIIVIQQILYLMLYIYVRIYELLDFIRLFQRLRKNMLNGSDLLLFLRVLKA